MCEVRDKQARDALERFPYEIKIRHPSPEAINAGRSAESGISRQSGDLPRPLVTSVAYRKRIFC